MDGLKSIEHTPHKVSTKEHKFVYCKILNITTYTVTCLYIIYKKQELHGIIILNVLHVNKFVMSGNRCSLDTPVQNIITARYRVIYLHPFQREYNYVAEDLYK